MKLRLFVIITSLRLIAAGAFHGHGFANTSWQAHLQKGRELREDTSLGAKERFAKAEAEYRIALKKLLQTLPGMQVKTREIRDLFNELESIIRTQAKYEALIPVIKQKIAIFTEYKGQNNILTCTAHFNLAGVYEKLERYSEAANEFGKAREIYEALGNTKAAQKMTHRISALKDIKRAHSDTSEKPDEKPLQAPPSKADALPTGDYNRFTLPPDIIKHAVEFGKHAEYELDEFGSLDFGINKFSLGKKTGYVKIITPFVQLASMSKYYAKKNEVYSPEEIGQTLKRPFEVKVVLFLSGQTVDEEVTCLIKAKGLSLDLSDNKMSAHFCDKDKDECVKAVSYAVFNEKLKHAKHFTLILQTPSIGEHQVNVDAQKIW